MSKQGNNQAVAWCQPWHYMCSVTTSHEIGSVEFTMHTWQFREADTASAAATGDMELDVPLLLSVTGGLGAFEQQPDGSKAFVRDDDCIGAQ
jgi:hypothetical protein